MTDDFPKTLQEAVLYFADLDRCRALVRDIRWPDGLLICPACGAKGEDVGEIKTRHMINCKKCRTQTSLTKGTIFEASKITLDKWMVGFWLVVNAKNSISSHELGRSLTNAYGTRQMPQKTAWFMVQRIRAALEDWDHAKFDGPAEADAKASVEKVGWRHWSFAFSSPC